MDLVITDPIPSDYKQYHTLVTEPHIQNEFHNFRGQQLGDTKSEIDFWVKNEGKTLPYFLRLLKITTNSEAGFWDENNSHIIGFIANLQAGPTEQMHSGFNTLINFGISKRFEGKGVMTVALKMTMQRLYELEFNISTAFVKPNNPASSKVLEKCGYDLVAENPLGKSYAKALKIDMDLYKSSLNL